MVSGEEDLFSGPKEMLEVSQAIKKSIQYNLGRRGGPRWSLPHQYIGKGDWGKWALLKSDLARFCGHAISV